MDIELEALQQAAFDTWTKADAMEQKFIATTMFEIPRCTRYSKKFMNGNPMRLCTCCWWYSIQKEGAKDLETHMLVDT